MAVGTPVLGAIANGTTSASPAFPATSAVDDALYVAAFWGNSANAEPTVPSGWSKVGDTLSTNGGAGTWGAAAGPRWVSLWRRDTNIQSANEAGSVTVSNAGGTTTTNNVLSAICFTVSKATSGVVHEIIAGADSTSGTAYSAAGTGPASPVMANGSRAVVLTAWIPNNATQSSNSFTMTGTGTAGLTGLNAGGNTSGHDVRWIAQHRAITGTPSASATGTVAMTGSAAVTGSSLVVIISESAAQNYTSDPTDNEALSDNAVASLEHGRAPSDTEGLTDAARTVAVAADRAMSDTLGLSDPRAFDVGRAFVEGMGLSDTLAGVLSQERAPADNVGLSDAQITRQIVGERTPADVTGLVDTVSQVRSHARLPNDSAGLTDPVVRAHGMPRSVEDNLGLTDALSTTQSRDVQVQDSSTMTDLWVLGFGQGVGHNDSSTLSDSLVIMLARSVPVTDNEGLTDALASVMSHIRNIAESAGLADGAISAHMDDRVYQEPVNLTDEVVVTGSRSFVMSDLNDLIDEVVVDKGSLNGITDNEGLTDGGQSQHKMAVGVNDMAMTDSVTVQHFVVNIFTRTINDLLIVEDPGFKRNVFEDLQDSTVMDEEMSVEGEQVPVEDARNVQDSENLTDGGQSQHKMAAGENLMGLGDTVTIELKVVLTRSIEDRVILADLGSEKRIAETIVNPMALADDVDRIGQTESLTISDSESLTDSVGRALVYIRTLADNMGLTDARAVADNANPVDEMGITDSIVVAHSFTREINDHAGPYESLTRVGDVSAVVSDALGLTDVLQVVEENAQNLTDAAGPTDTPAIGWMPHRTESAGLTDFLLVQVALVHPINDSAGLRDGIAKDVAVTIVDGVGLIDTTTKVSAMNLGIVDDIGAVDNAGRLSDYDRAHSDTLGITDSRVGDYTATVRDDMPVTDSLVRASDTPRSLGDTLVLSDSLFREVPAVRQMVENLGLTDTLRRDYATEPVDVMDLRDAVVRTQDHRPSHQDQVGLTDSIEVASVMNRSLSDNVALSDEVSSVRGFLRSVVDEMSVSDQASGLVDFNRTLGDEMPIVDAASKVHDKRLDLSDTIWLVDWQATLDDASFNRSLANILIMNDAVEVVMDQKMTPATDPYAEWGDEVLTPDAGIDFETAETSIEP